MSSQVNDNIYDLAAETVEELGLIYSDGTMPKLVQNTYDRLCTALTRDDLDAIHELTHELGQYLAVIDD